MVDEHGSQGTSRRLDGIQSLIESLPAPLFIVDSGLRLIAFNAAAIRLSVELTGEVPRPGRPAGGVLPANLLADAGTPIREALNGAAGQVDLETRTLAGQRRVFEAHAWPAADDSAEPAAGLLFHDVSARTAAERAGQRGQAALREVVARTPLLLLAFDPDGVVRFAEGGGFGTAGITAPEFVGTNVLTGPDALLVHEQEDGTTRASLFLDDRHFELYYTPVHSPVGELSGYVAAALDVTLRSASERRAVAEQKRESLERLAHGLAHELGNSLTVFVGNATMLRDLAESAPLRDLADQLVEASWRTNTIVRQLLSFADGPELGDLAPVDVNGTVEEVVRLVRGFVPASLGITVLTESRLPAIEAATRLLREVVATLLGNAVDAAGPNGSVRIVTSSDCELPVDPHSLQATRDMPSAPRVCVRIEDDGPGMDRETLDSAVDPYFTTKFPGRGLGLANAVGILRAHHGGLHIRSVPGSGTVVTIAFPALP